MKEYTDEEIDVIMGEFEDDMRREHDKNIAHDKPILQKIKYSVTEEYYADIISYLDECEACDGTLELVNSHPNFDPQEKKEYLFKKAWVDQHVGICGDDYHGDIWIFIETLGKYLKFYYSM